MFVLNRQYPALIRHGSQQPACTESPLCAAVKFSADLQNPFIPGPAGLPSHKTHHACSALLPGRTSPQGSRASPGSHSVTAECCCVTLLDAQWPHEAGSASRGPQTSSSTLWASLSSSAKWDNYSSTPSIVANVKGVKPYMWEKHLAAVTSPPAESNCGRHPSPSPWLLGCLPALSASSPPARLPSLSRLC